jgi:hypothetical protein
MDEIQQQATSPESTERHEVFRGHLDECLEHLRQCLEAHFPRGLKGAEKARQPIADFCAVEATTVRSWLRQENPPSGIGRVSLMCFLDLLGYRVIELEKFQSMREFAELIGYRLISVKEAAEALGYANNHHIYEVLLLNEKIGADKEKRMWNICKERRLELAQKKEEARQKYQLSFSLMDSVHQRKVSAVISIMEGLLSLLESNEVGDAFEASLNDLSPIEKNAMLRLSEKLHELSIKLAQQNQQKGDQ